jgi:hypothetical protein
MVDLGLEEIWRIREEEIYPAMFGERPGNIYPLSQELFSNRFGQKDTDPRWWFYGVLQFAPTDNRAAWLYLTSGYSNPWEEKAKDYKSDGESGSGVEFVFQCAEPGDWAIRTLQNMLAFDLLLAAGRYPNGVPLQIGDRVPLREPLNGDPGCQIRNLVVTKPEGIPSGFSLPSGKATFLSFTGITDPELDFAKIHGSDALVNRLREAGCHPVTDPWRKSLI